MFSPSCSARSRDCYLFRLPEGIGQAGDGVQLLHVGLFRHVEAPLLNVGPHDVEADKGAAGKVSPHKAHVVCLAVLTVHQAAQLLSCTE